MHTRISDGTDTPEEILAHVKKAGIELFSVTDHDAIRGSEIIRAIRRSSDPKFLAGVEFSCKDDEGKYHILGYGYDPETFPIREVVQKGHSLRMKKVAARLDYLRDTFGFQFPEQEIRELLAQDNPGKPHIGNLMVKYGFARTKEEAIEDYINKIRFRSEYVRPEEAIRGILEAGGIPVLAHPSYGNGDQLITGAELERRIRRLKEFGLQGLEAFYSGFTPKLRDELLDYAGRYDLYVTAGSDYHGTNKLVRLGDTGMDERTEAPDGMRRFLSAVSDAIDG